MKYERFVWDDKYSVGVLLINAQHRHFFEIVDQSFDLLESDKPDKQKVLDIINKLIEYGKFHLATEERYFKKFGFEHSEEHTSAHNMFRKKADEYYKKLLEENNPGKFAGEVAEFAKNWLSEHILIEDKQYSKLFIEHGLN